jgi:hypothetical protein
MGFYSREREFGRLLKIRIVRMVAIYWKRVKIYVHDWRRVMEKLGLL